MPQIGGADDLSAGAFRRASLEGAMSGLTPAPTKRVHDPSRVATHGVALWSAGDSPFRSARIVMALLVSRLAADPRFASGPPMRRALRSVHRPPRPGGRASEAATPPPRRERVGQAAVAASAPRICIGRHVAPAPAACRPRGRIHRFEIKGSPRDADTCGGCLSSCF
jgi:hypothetical protein